MVPLAKTYAVALGTTPGPKCHCIKPLAKTYTVAFGFTPEPKCHCIELDDFAILSESIQSHLGSPMIPNGTG